MHFYPTFHITYTASNAKCSKKPTTFQFSDGHDAVGKHHPDKLLLNSSFVAQFKKKNKCVTGRRERQLSVFFLDWFCQVALYCPLYLLFTYHILSGIFNYTVTNHNTFVYTRQYENAKELLISNQPGISTWRLHTLSLKPTTIISCNKIISQQQAK